MRSNLRVQRFRPGEEVPKSGIYRVTHCGHHHDHEVTCFSGERFPECHECRDGVRFALLMAAHAVWRHAHFCCGNQLRLAAEGRRLQT